MAVADSLPGVTVDVVTNDIALHEYEDDEVLDTDRSTTRYIEAIEGQAFGVRFTVDSNVDFLGSGLDFELSIDGQIMRSDMIEKAHVGQRGYTCTIGGINCSKTLRRDFYFAALRIDEDGQANAADVERVKHLGSICVNVRHVKNLREIKVASSGRAKEVNSPDIVSEKALKGKAISHSVLLKDVKLKAPQRRTRNSQQTTLVRTDDVDPSGQPQAIYTFRYRSRDALKSMLLIPQSRAPTPPRSPGLAPLTKRDPNSLTQAEVAEMQKRLQEFENKSQSEVKIKREQDENSAPRPKARKNRKVAVLELDDAGEIVSETFVRKSQTPDATKLVNID